MHDRRRVLLAVIVGDNSLERSVQHEGAAVHSRQPRERLREVAQSIERVDVRRVSILHERLGVCAKMGQDEFQIGLVFGCIFFDIGNDAEDEFVIRLR